MLADVILHYDSLNYEYTEMCRDDSLPLYLRHAANRALGVLNKYYGRTDESDLYRLAIRRYLVPLTLWLITSFL
jgi:hypothetical protein